MRPQREPGARVDKRLVDVAVDYQRVRALGPHRVAGGFQHPRILPPVAVGAPAGCERFRARRAPAVEVGCRRRVPAGRASAKPEFARGNVRRARAPQIVERPAVRFENREQPVFVAELCEVVEIVFGEEVGDRALEVVEEARGFCGAFDRVPERRRQPLYGVVSAPLFELSSSTR